MPVAFVTRRIPESGLALVRAAAETRVFPEARPPRREELLSGVAGCQGLLCLLTDRIDGEIMDAGELRIIANYAMGYENIDVGAATERGIPVTNAPAAGLRESPADFTLALLLAAGRRVVEGDRRVREGRFAGWGPMELLGTDLHGKTLGIVGAGRIGSAVARRARGFDMRILYHSRTRKAELEAETGARYRSLDALLREADYVTLHVPLTEATHRLIGRDELGRMKRTALLVNTSRGSVVDEAALGDALERGELAGAALDVFEDEPDVHPALLDRPDVVLTPHAASATEATRSEMAVLAAENLVAGLRGRRPPNLVNPEVLRSQDGE